MGDNTWISALPVWLLVVLPEWATVATTTSLQRVRDLLTAFSSMFATQYLVISDADSFNLNYFQPLKVDWLDSSIKIEDYSRDRRTSAWLRLKGRPQRAAGGSAIAGGCFRAERSYSLVSRGIPLKICINDVISMTCIREVVLFLYLLDKILLLQKWMKLRSKNTVIAHKLWLKWRNICNYFFYMLQLKYWGGSFASFKPASFLAID